MSHIIAYRVAPQCERKAARELRENGRRAYLPLEVVGKRKAPVARGYIFAETKPHDAKHVLSKVGDVNRAELIRLYPRRDRGHVAQDPFGEGDNVEIMRGPFTAFKGVVVSKRGKRGWIVDVSIFGRMSRCTVATHYMRKHDPG